MKIYSKFWRKFSQLKSIFYFSFLSIMAEPSATEAYHIRITQFVFIFAVAHILFSLPHLWSKAPILCVFSILYKLKLPPFIVCAFQQALAFLYKTMKWIKKNTAICTCTHRALYLYTFYVFYFISYQFINFCCWARECLVYARCTKQLKIHLLQTFLYTASTSPKYISLCHNVSQKVVILPFIICGKCTSSLCMFA